MFIIIIIIIIMPIIIITITFFIIIMLFIIFIFILIVVMMLQVVLGAETLAGIVKKAADSACGSRYKPGSWSRKLLAARKAFYDYDILREWIFDQVRVNIDDDQHDDEFVVIIMIIFANNYHHHVNNFKCIFSKLI